MRDFLRAHADVSCSLDLSDRLVDLVNEGVDCAIRIGELSDSAWFRCAWPTTGGWWWQAPSIWRAAACPRRPTI
jgi:DNA-binding transcriptional LysR family regulator